MAQASVPPARPAEGPGKPLLGGFVLTTPGSPWPEDALGQQVCVVRPPPDLRWERPSQPHGLGLSPPHRLSLITGSARPSPGCWGREGEDRGRWADFRVLRRRGGQGCASS